ncbi:hypothetical protein [Alienimonas chondri]|uniref:Tetratricopeptide repeat protein n=1 Tax=Alienimonas chondri TaxID=2681879 RepID=A0ABX1VG41_9PLAN|nr:hypothetical protein [Alienimonas chondri]NNJ26850.1 hypothetical protein [Alienimonas chondri]
MLASRPAARSAGLALLALLLTASPAPAQKYTDAAAAVRAGFGHLRTRDYEAAVGPLEDARDLLSEGRAANAQPSRDLLNVQRALLTTYGELGETEDYWDTGDWILRHADSPATRSLTMRAMRRYARGKRDRDQLREHYEAALTADPNDRIALRLLSELAEDDRDPKAAAERLGRLIDLDAATPAGPDRRDRAEYARLLEQSDEHERAATLFAELAAEAEQLEAARAENGENGGRADGEDATPFGPSLTAANLHLKTARNWLEADRTDEAREAAATADRLGDAGLDTPHDYYFHSFLGGVWAKLDEPAKALPHFEKAAEVATIDGYRKSSREAAQKARDAIAASDQ